MATTGAWRNEDAFLNAPTELVELTLPLERLR